MPGLPAGFITSSSRTFIQGFSYILRLSVVFHGFLLISMDVLCSWRAKLRLLYQLLNKFLNISTHLCYSHSCITACIYISRPCWPGSVSPLLGQGLGAYGPDHGRRPGPPAGHTCFRPRWCSIGFHPLHTLPAMLEYIHCCFCA